MVAACFVFLTWAIFFIFFQSISIYGGDAGDLVTAAYTRGIAHPPGYPLYTMLGYVLSLIPVNTIAWRVGFLSSLPAAGALTIIYLMTYQITHSIRAGATASALLGLTYVYWLYSIVPEVFLLHILLLTCAMYVALQWQSKSEIRYLYILAFVFGLGLSHHHLIIFALPSIGILLYQSRQALTHIPVKKYAIMLCAFLIGLLPYLWVPYVIHDQPYISWSNPSDIEGFIRLVTRADYGTFSSGVTIGSQPTSRVLQFVFLFENYLHDFTIFGLLFACLGLLALYRRNRLMFYVLGSLFLINGPLYFFYASYLYFNGFLIATAERFLLPSYISIALLAGIGTHECTYGLQGLCKKKHVPTLLRATVELSPQLLVAIILASSLYINYSKLAHLTNDQTAENFGKDIVAPVERRSIVFLNGDIAIFNTQYVIYALGFRQDVVPIHLNKFLKGDMNAMLRKRYSDVSLPPYASRLSFFHSFIDANYSRHPIYFTQQMDGLPREYTLIPQGLLLRLYKRTEAPPYVAIKAADERAWNMYHDPHGGSLRSYPNLMLAHVTDYYRAAYLRSSLTASIYGKDYTRAIIQAQRALDYDPEDTRTLSALVLLYTDSDKCHEAELMSQQLTRSTFEPLKDMNYLQIMNQFSNKCEDATKQSVWKKRLDDAAVQNQVHLDTL